MLAVMTDASLVARMAVSMGSWLVGKMVERLDFLKADE
jgi:hypothetical protein